MDIHNIKSSFLKEIIERGFLYQSSNLDGLDNALVAGNIIGYTGFDMTARSLHVGNLVAIMLLKWFEKFGNKPIILLGGGTTRIGDPSDKNEARPILTDEQIADNMSSLRRVFDHVFDSPNIVNNADWLDKLGYIEILREVGSCFSINKMIKLEAFKRRLEPDEDLSFLEFNYLIFQSYDFLQLYRSHDCIVQFGGSDQWANIINGADLIRRKERAEAFALTTPLIATSSGQKMGKSADGAVWLNSDMKVPYDYWQFWRNTPDQDVGRFLRLYTFLPLSEIRELEKLEGADINYAKKILADEATKFIHGEVVLDEIHSMNSGSMAENSSTPSVVIRKGDRLSIVDILNNAGIVDSKSEAKRLIRGGGVRFSIDGNEVSEVLADENTEIAEKCVISIGKNRKILVHESD